MEFGLACPLLNNMASLKQSNKYRVLNAPSASNNIERGQTTQRRFFIAPGLPLSFPSSAFPCPTFRQLQATTFAIPVPQGLPSPLPLGAVGDSRKEPRLESSRKVGGCSGQHVVGATDRCGSSRNKISSTLQ